jgi:DNA-binding transcriptional regulator YiaG
MDGYERALQKARAVRALPSPAACRAIREAAGLSLREMGAALDTTHTNIWYWEHGRHRPAHGDVRERYVALLTELRRVAA